MQSHRQDLQSEILNKNNNFDFGRMLAALVVLVSHAWPLRYNISPFGHLGAFGVFSFFTMSGYLVSASWKRDPNLIRFLARRSLRIFPGLIVAILVAALIVGPAFTTLPLKDYFASPTFHKYTSAIFLYPMQYLLPGVFEKNPIGSVVNGSLWTLPMEVAMYVVLAITSFILSLLRRSIIPVIATAFILGCALEIKHPEGDFFTMEVTTLARTGTCFAYGALLWHLRDKVRLYWWSIFPACLFVAITYGTQAEIWALLIMVPYAMLSLTTASLPFIRHTGRFGDPSYGVYIYSYPIQQSLVFSFPTISMPAFISSAIVLSIAAGYISWHLVEKPVLKLKFALPRSKQAVSV